MTSLSDAIALTTIKEYYEKLRSEINSKDDAIVISVMSCILFSVSAVKCLDDSEDKRKILIADIFDKIGILLNSMEYDEKEVHKKVMSLVDMLMMDFKVIQSKKTKLELN